MKGSEAVEESPVFWKQLTKNGLSWSRCVDQRDKMKLRIEGVSLQTQQF